MSKQVFSESFLQEMRDYLEEKTEDGSCVTRTQLCEDLEVDSRLDGVISSIIKLDLLDDYRIVMGPGGGIGHKNKSRPTKQREAGSYTATVSDEDITKVLAKFEDLCGNGAVVPRKVVASAVFGNSTTKSQNLVSAVLKHERNTEFGTKPGKGGGVFKKSVRPELTNSKPSAPAAAAPAVPAVPAPDMSDVSPEAEEGLTAPLDMELEEQAEKRESSALGSLRKLWAANKSAKESGESTDA